ncbi:MAG: glycosyltransferase family 2 protein [Chloroflexi bacterium]|nr:glycosyltransferase family 2 protein [Chloroflexota bacterium]
MIKPKVFVLVLSYNGKQWLKDCLPSVVAMDYANFETVVIDNGSTDDTQNFLRETFPQMHVVTLQPNRGYAGGFDAGLEYAAQHGAEYFLVMNNDTVIDSHALTALVETAQLQERAGFVTGKVYFYDRRDVFQSVGKKDDPITWIGHHIGYEEKDVGQYDKVNERIFVDDIYTLVSRRMYDEIGGYDPQFYLQCEEFDWQLRAKKANWKIYYTPDAKLWHRGSASTGGLGSPIVNFFLERSRMIVFAKHASALRYIRYTVWSAFRAAYRLIWAMLQMDSFKIKARAARILGIAAGVFWLISHRPATGIPWVIQKLS